jgi:hypothetical protein
MQINLLARAALLEKPPENLSKAYAAAVRKTA